MKPRFFISPLPFPRPLTGLLVAGVAAAVFVSCSTSGGGAAMKAPPGSEASSGEMGAKGEAEREWVEYEPSPLVPPDGKWLVDDDGKRYFLDKVPKIEGWYRWVDEEKKIVRARNLMPFEVDSYDDQYFYFRVYEIDRPAYRKARRSVPKGPTPEDREEIEASYESEIGEADVLRLMPFDQGLPRQGQWRNGFDLADMNGDGELDIVHGPPRKAFSRPIIFLGDGKGNWRGWAEARFPRAPYDYGDAAAADFNGDGHMDMALGMHLQGLIVLIGDGQGLFRPWSLGVPLKGMSGADGGPIFSSRGIETVDWNGDGRPDVLAVSEGPSSGKQLADGTAPPPGKEILINQGDGTWEIRSMAGDTLIGSNLAVGDFNQDGRLDFVTDSRVVGSRGLLNLGQANGDWELQPLEPIRPKAIVWSVAAADFDADGHDDLVLAYRSRELGENRGGLDLLYARPGREPSWERRPIVVTDPGKVGFRAVATGNLDGDGAVDLVALTRQGETWVFRGDGQGFLVRERADELAVPASHYYCSGYYVKLQDLDGDERDEIVASFAGEQGSEQLIPGLQTRCPSGGALRVWTPLAKASKRGARRNSSSTP